MKKIFLSLVLIIGLFGCSDSNSAAQTKYYDMLKLISEREEFLSSSENFTVSAEISNISQGRYRYFVTVDNPRIAMYEVEILAIEEGKEYINEVAANAGVLLDEVYNMIPNQSDVSRGYISGINISGETSNEHPVLYVLVQWHNKELTIVSREYFRIEL
ncbi:MAG: hypothetical protein ACI4WM_02665 [Erysipelotrichaceae bacterium]